MLYFNKHVYSCLAQGHLVLLDVKSDRYHILFPEDLSALVPKIAGLRDLINPSHIQSPKVADEIISCLFKQQLITCSPTEGKEVSSGLPIYSPDHDAGLEMDLDGSISLPHLAPVISATFFAACQKYGMTLEQSINAISKKKEPLVQLKFKEKVLRLTSIFHNIRPVVPIPRNCYLDSLALIQFLNFYDIKCELIFGVIADPFYAHCWVEWGGLCLNDRSDVPSSLVPILRV